MPGSEIFTALQTGVVDATEWVGPYNDLAFGLQGHRRVLLLPPAGTNPARPSKPYVNAEALATLPDDLKLMLETATRAINQDVLDEFTARNAAALRTMVEEHGVEVRRLPDDVLERFRELSEEVVTEAAADGELAGRILASYQSFLAEVRAYHAISEQAYINATGLTQKRPRSTALPL